MDKVSKSKRKNLPQPEEATVLDWVKSVVRRRPISVAEVSSARRAGRRSSAKAPAIPRVAERITFRVTAAHLRLPVALLLAMLGQIGFDMHSQAVGTSIVLFGLALVLVGWAVWEGDFTLERPEASKAVSRESGVRVPFLASGVLFSVLAFFAAKGDRFTRVGVFFWAVAVLSVLAAFWDGGPDVRGVLRRIWVWLKSPHFNLSLDTFGMAVVFAYGVGFFFKFAELDLIPINMWSDHAEKLVDIMEILGGATSVFFPRNAGREPMQFYAVAAAVKYLGASLDFLALKEVTALAGFLCLPYIYLFGKEVGGRNVGLAGLILVAIGYWPNAISRSGMRLPFHPLFLAPAMYYLVRGLRLRRRNDLLLCGAAVGLGIYGYTSARLTPLVIVAGVALFALHRQAQGVRWRSLVWLVVIGVIAAVVAVPMLRAALDMPEAFLFRTVTRVGSAERPLPGPALVILASNMWNALRMFNWDNGGVWILSIPGRPALDWITGALFGLGLAILVVRYVRRREWLDLFLLISIPLLLLPSALSLAFPDENPHPSRAGGAIVPVFIIAAIGLAAIPDWARSIWKGRRSLILGVGTSAILLILATLLNYRLYFVDFKNELDHGTLNTNDIGHVIKGFAESVGTYQTAHVIPYPYWVDTRLVGVNAGRPEMDYAIRPEDLGSLTEEMQAQLFILKPEDSENVERLRELFPSGTLSRFVSPIQDRDFLIYTIPSRLDLQLEPTPVPQ
ncbi:MAG: hypothetical protein A2Z37_08310 [Chloroflexi bacterium RBG_19FT_COMBO_62_14]|nr:MAG: hypothetical protein A2Z37_08310 [Chloroflexi bacterium RBG_19FT_COMBO_62_14]